MYGYPMQPYSAYDMGPSWVGLHAEDPYCEEMYCDDPYCPNPYCQDAYEDAVEGERRRAHRSSQSGRSEPYNLHPYPTEGRRLGPVHRAAEEEGMTLRHIPGGCYRNGRCEKQHSQAIKRELHRRGVEIRAQTSAREALRISRGLAPAPAANAGPSQSAPPPQAPPSQAPVPQQANAGFGQAPSAPPSTPMSRGRGRGRARGRGRGGNGGMMGRGSGAPFGGGAMGGQAGMNAQGGGMVAQGGGMVARGGGGMVARGGGMSAQGGGMGQMGGMGGMGGMDGMGYDGGAEGMGAFGDDAEENYDDGYYDEYQGF
ncbi:MAG: hypothetical protein Q9209_007214 [Squamulea sp. 1 TL-2023]